MPRVMGTFVGRIAMLEIMAFPAMVRQGLAPFIVISIIALVRPLIFMALCINIDRVKNLGGRLAGYFASHLHAPDIVLFGI